MAVKRIPLMLLPLSSMRTIGARFRGVGVKILPFYPSIRYDLRSIEVEGAPEHYCTIAFFSAAIWAMLISLFVTLLLATSQLPAPVKLLFPFLAFMVSLLFFLVLHLAYPNMIAKSMAAKIDRELIFAMRDMLIQISSGIPLFTVIENIGEANYEYVAPEFREVARRVKAGGPLLDELEAMAIRTQSEYLKKTVWQLVTAVRAGANLTTTLKSIVKVLVDYQFALSKSFNAELNFIILIYLMVAAVMPTIGTTILVIFSVFGLLGVTPEVFAGIVAMSFMGQLAIIGYVRMKRPNLYM
ncbi:MAG: type II secretion system F family protein [Candidatus Micrarchaeota archaeon]|nr:type II secretion system F family protein [Candidatus Micrarchaeota archaeon]